MMVHEMRYFNLDSDCRLKNRKSLVIDVTWRTATLTKRDPGILTGRDGGINAQLAAGCEIESPGLTSNVFES